MGDGPLTGTTGEGDSARRLERRSRQLALLSEATHRLNRVLEVDMILRTLIETALELVGASGGTYGVLRDGVMVFTAYDHAGRWQPMDLVFLPNTGSERGTGVPSHVMVTREPYLSNDMPSDPYVRQNLVVEFGIRNLIDLPILNRENMLLGCFELHNKADGEPFDGEDVSVLQALTAAAAVAFDNARGLAEQRRMRMELREADRRKNELVAKLGHELRNPLGAIANAVDALERATDRGRALEQVLPVLGRQMKNVTRLVDVLLELSSPATSSPDPEAAGARSAAPPCRIVLVDDNADALAALKLLLEMLGHEVTTASNGVDGVALIEARQPDVAFIDVAMPVMDGYEVARRVRARGTAGGVRLVALTGFGQVHDRQQAYAAGFDLHLTKPIDPERIATVVAELGARAPLPDRGRPHRLLG